MVVLQPQHARMLVWASLRSLAATCRISIDLSSWRYLDVSVPSVRSHRLVSHLCVLIVSNEWVAPFGNLRVKVCLTTRRSLSQFNHVLHRLLLPRYPPYALSSFILVLIVIFTNMNICYGYSILNNIDNRSRLLSDPVM